MREVFSRDPIVFYTWVCKRILDFQNTPLGEAFWNIENVLFDA